MGKEPRMPLRPKNHIVGDVGQTTTALILKKWGWTADIIQSDYGEDISSDIFINNSRTALNFRCQVKSFYSNDGQVRKLKSGGYSVSIDAGLCLFWSECYYPIILAVYDNESEKVYWSNINSQIRAKVLNIKSATISIRIDANDLQVTKNILESSVSQYYSKIMMIDSPALSCDVTPVIMPFYRAVPVSDFILTHLELDGIYFNFEVTDYERLPSWLTAIKNIEGKYLNGWNITCILDSVDEFYNKLKKILVAMNFSLSEGEWISFIVSPVRLCESNRNKVNTLWNKEITDWSNFSKIDGKCFSDFNYAFKLPPGFLDQIAAKSVSWGKNYSIEPTLDIAIQVYSSTATTPVYRESIRQQRKQISGNFISWKCLKSDVEKLGLLLNKIDLEFKEVMPNLNKGEYASGIICNSFFSPEVGLYSSNHEWNTFEKGKVESLLKNSGVINILPGEKGDSIIDEIIYSLFGISSENIPEKIMTQPFYYVSGMPIDHSGRLICFQKLIEIEEETFKNHDESFISNELMVLLKDTGIYYKISIDSLDCAGANIMLIDVTLTPGYSVSTEKIVNKYKEIICSIFNRHVDFYNIQVKNNYNTMRILECFGEIYFEKK